MNGFEGIPDHWRTSRLDWVATINARIGWKALTAAEYQAEGYAFLATPNIKNSEIDFENVNYISEFRYKESPDLQLEIGDVLLAKDGFTLGTVNLVRKLPRPATVNGSIAVLRPFGIHSGYLRYTIACTATQRRIDSLKDGMDVLHLFQRDIKKLPLPLPPHEEQRRISDFLDAQTVLIDKLLASFERQASVLAERGDVALPLTLSGSRMNQGTVATGLAWAPTMNRAAQVVPLIRVLQLQRGADLSEDQRISGSFPVITTAGVAGWHHVALAKGPGVVIGRYGSVGNVHWVTEDYWPHNTTLYVRSFHGNNPRYCYHLLRSLPYEMEQARAAVPGVNRNDLHRQRVVILPYDLQAAVAKQLDTEQEQLSAAHARIRKAEALLIERRQALITAAVTGQIDVSTASGRGIED